MKFTANKEHLIKAISTAGRLATSRATLPILQNLYLEVRQHDLLVRSTDLEQTLEISVPGEVGATGRITVPARLFGDYLVNNDDQQIELELKETTLHLTSANHRGSLIGLAAEDYPTLPELAMENQVSLPSVGLKKLINQTVFATAFSDTQPVLNSVLWRFQDKTLLAVATDGYRLAQSKVSLPTSNLTGDYLLPRRTLQEVEKLSTEGEIEISFGGSQVRFAVERTVLISRLLDGAFPAFEAIIPQKKELEVKLNQGQLLKSLKLASLFSRDSAFSTKLMVGKSKLVITAVSPQLGESSNEVELLAPNEKELTIAVNAQYLIDYLGLMESEVNMALIDEKSPIVITPPDDKSFLYLVMPLRGQ